MSSIDVRETSGVTTRLILAYVRRTLGDEAVVTVHRRAGVAEPIDRLEDETSWSSYDTKIALLGAATELSDDPATARRIGELAIDDSIASPIKFLLSLLGSPAAVLARIDRVAAKFTTVGRMRPIEVNKGSALIGYRLLDGYEPHEVNCEYNCGVLSQVTAVFGLPPATVKHRACQARGAPECVYEVSWRTRRRFLRRRRRVSDVDVNAVYRQLQALQETVSDLVSLGQLDDVLSRVATRASTAVRATQYLLAIQLDGERKPRVHSEGIAPEQAAALGSQLISTGRLDLDDTEVVTAEVVSSRRSYGRLAALFPAGLTYLSEEHNLLEAYARLAAAALDSATALAEARARGLTAQLLLDLATDLAEAHTVAEVARLAARAVPEVLGAPRGSVFLFDRQTEALVLGDHHGWDRRLLGRLEELVIGWDDTPEVRRLVEARRPTVYTIDHPDPFVAETCRRLSTGAVVTVPLVVAGEFHGVIFASWPDGDLHGPDDSFFARAEGLAHHVSTSLARVGLLEQVRHQATHDSLTGLPNRTLLEDRLEQALKTRHRTGRDFALLFIDLDRFKPINDSLGHTAGDDLLQQAAQRLRRVVREADSVARIGGDEFILLLADVDSARDAEVVAGKIVEVFAEAFHVAGRDVYVTASVGIAVPDDDGNGVDELLRRADGAMYDAKVSGRNSWCWSRGLTADPLERMSLISDLRGAIGHGQLTLHYQPQLTSDGEFVGVEALVRWDHPDRGLLSPGIFLPLAEESGLVVPLDVAVVRMALDQVARWRRDGHPPVRLAVNVSARTFCDTSFLTTVTSVFAATGYPPELVEFELTEHEQFPHFDRARVIASALVDMGVGIAIDDVGRGYSSLSWLHELPVRRVKLDRSFVAEVNTSRAAAELTTGLISLGRRLGCTVLAEGVEDERQLEFLREQGCDEVQGYYYARPLPPEALLAWIEDRSAVAA